MWIFAYETDKQDDKWILYGEEVEKLKYPDEDKYEVFMQDEMFYGEGEQIADGDIDGWQLSNPKVGYIIEGNHLFMTQQEAQRSGIKALMSGRIF